MQLRFLKVKTLLNNAFKLANGMRDKQECAWKHIHNSVVAWTRDHNCHKINISLLFATYKSLCVHKNLLFLKSQLRPIDFQLSRLKFVAPSLRITQNVFYSIFTGDAEVQSLT